MHASEHTQIVEAFLLIEQPRQRLGHWTKALAALDTPEAPPTVAVIAYYDPTSDQALIDLQFERTVANMKFVVDVAILAEVGMVQPAELSEGERARFLADRLTRCTIRVTTQSTAASALTELVRRIKDGRMNKVSNPPPPPPARSVAPRGDTQDPVMLVNAKGTRDDLERMDPNADFVDPLAGLDDLGDGPEPPPPPRRDNTSHERPMTKPDAAHYFKSAERNRTVEMPFEMSQRLIVESSQMMKLSDLKPPGYREPHEFPLPPPAETPAPEIVRAKASEKTPPPIPTRRTEKITVRAKSPNLAELKPTQRPSGPIADLKPPTQRPSGPIANLKPPTQRPSGPIADLKPPTHPPTMGRHVTPPPRVRTDHQRTDPYLPTGGPALPNVIYARYLRSGRWVPVRIGALSLKGAALLAGALPRANDRVDVAFAFGSYRALVRGTVLKVSTMREATASGAATFSIAFDLDDGSRRQLTNLLTAARDAKITIKPPPPRATRRFPVEWQVALGTIRGAVKATALDVSTQGMFVQPHAPLEIGATLTFSVMLDDGTSPIAGRAKVVRQINEPEAKQCGLLPGFGLLLVSMSEADRMRWLGFLARIERRADKRVLIGADPARLAELQAGLASLGYAVTGGTDPGALVQLANSDGRQADAVLIDAGWLQNEASASLMENLFSARNVPCVTMQGEVRRARQAIDKLLEVVV